MACQDPAIAPLVKGQQAGDAGMAPGVVTSERTGDVLVLTLDNAPSNALTASMRREIIAAFASPEQVTAVVLRGAGAVFSSAIPLHTDREDPDLAALCRAVEACALPVVAAVSGPAIGPGAELALATTARVAGPGARLALPDVAFGLPPAAGASQRLPRLVGAAAALRMLLTGRSVAAAEGLALGLFDAVAEDDATEAAIALARTLASEPQERLLEDARTFRAAVAAARREYHGKLPAMQRIIDCVEAALVLPLENGLAFEAVAREDLEMSEDTAGLRAAAQAERRVLALPTVIARAHPADVDRIGLHGTDPGLTRLALLALAQGIGITWVAEDGELLSRSLAGIDDQLDAEVRAGRLSQATRQAARGLLAHGADPADMQGAGLHVHAEGSGGLAPDLATSGAPHLLLADEAGGLGLALAPSGRACELALPDAVMPDQVATAVAVLRRLGVPPVLVRQRPVLGARLVQAGAAALVRLVDLGVPRHIVADALAAFGAALPEVLPPDPDVPPRPIPEVEVQHRWLAALANEGLKLIEAGIARRPSDIDHLLVAGYHFPRWRGGPMHQADQRGLMVLRRDLRLWAEEDAFWTPAPLLDLLIAQGRRLPALDG